MTYILSAVFLILLFILFEVISSVIFMEIILNVQIDLFKMSDKRLLKIKKKLLRILKGMQKKMKGMFYEKDDIEIQRIKYRIKMIDEEIRKRNMFREDKR